MSRFPLALLGALTWCREPVLRRWHVLAIRAQAGMSTAEYAVGTVAACAFAAVLFKVVTGGSIVTALGHLITKALATLS